MAGEKEPRTRSLQRSRELMRKEGGRGEEREGGGGEGGREEGREGGEEGREGRGREGGGREGEGEIEEVRCGQEDLSLINEG